MDGVELAMFIDETLEKSGTKKKLFYEKTGIKSATLSQWRTGVYNPSADAIEAVEKFFNVSFKTSVEKEKSSASEDAELYDDDLLIIELLGKLNSANRERAIAYLQGLVAAQ